MEWIYIVWIALALGCCVIEIMTITFYIAPFAVGALAALIAYYLGASELIQCIVFVGVSVFGLITIPKIARMVTKQSPAQDLAVNRVINQSARVTKPIDTQSSGQVDVEGELWLARLAPQETSSLNAGDICRVVDIDGTHLLVCTDRQSFDAKQAPNINHGHSH